MKTMTIIFNLLEATEKQLEMLTKYNDVSHLFYKKDDPIVELIFLDYNSEIIKDCIDILQKSFICASF